MKTTKYLTAALVFMMTFFLANAEVKADGPSLKFKKERHDFGTLYLNNLPEGKVDVEFTNDGTQPLVLSNVRACCGTRVVDWPKEPIMPGESGVAKVEFRIPPRVHNINRTVTIMSNSPNSPDIFRMSGVVTDQEPEKIIEQ